MEVNKKKHCDASQAARCDDGPDEPRICEYGCDSVMKRVREEVGYRDAVASIKNPRDALNKQNAFQLIESPSRFIKVDP